LTIANFETPDQTGQVVQSAMAMVTGFGYALLGAALLTGIGIILAVLLKHQGHGQARIVAGNT
jgi:hypothetical protein